MDEKTRNERIRQKAFERYVLDLARSFAPEEEQSYLKHRGRELIPLVCEIQLKGEYPKTRLWIRTHNPRSDIEEATAWEIWGNEQFFKDGEQRRSAAEIAGEILMWARGG